MAHVIVGVSRRSPNPNGCASMRRNCASCLRNSPRAWTCDSKADANVVIINTCGFIDLAKQESIDTIVEYADIKKAGGIDKLYVTGCLS